MTGRALSRLPAVPRATLAAAFCALALGSCGGSQAPRESDPGAASQGAVLQGGFDGAALPARGAAPGFTLEDQYARRVSLSSYRGEVVILAFLYPTCGATCVVIAEQIRGALDELERRIPVLIVSAEPAADTPAAVRRFLGEVSLSGRALYLTGTRAQLEPVWRAYRVQPASAGREAFASYTGVFLIDRSGRARDLFESEELTLEGLVHDLRKLEEE